MHYKLLLLYFNVFLFSWGCFSQTITITGTVLDTNKNHIVNASVIINSGTVIIGYNYSNEKGTYSISFEAKKGLDYTISANSLGYANETVALTFLNTSSNLEQNFSLKEKAETLNTVVLRADQKIKINRDTISYKLKSFQDGTERTVEDMLKKLPGIEVSEDGNIKALGKPIAKILIEGDDLADNNYKVISQNLNVDVLKNIEIISNYDENPVLKQFLNSDAVVLNLKLKDDKKAILFGKIEAGAGLENRYLGDANIGFISPGIKFLDLANLNNTGNPAQGQFQNYTVTTNGFNDFDKQFTVGTKPLVYLRGSNISIPDNNYIENTTLANNLLLNKRFNDSLKIRNSFYVYRDTFEKNYTNSLLYLLEDPISFNETNTFRNKNFRIENDFQLNYSPSKNSNIVANLNVLFDNGDNKNTLLFNDAPIEQRLDTKERLFDGQVQYTQKIKSGALVVDGYAASNNLSQDFLVSPNVITTNESDMNIISENEIILDYQGIDASTVFKTNKTAYSLTAGIQHLKETIKTAALNEANTSTQPIDSLSGNTSATNIIPHFQIKGEHELVENIFVQGDIDAAINKYEKNNFENTFFIPNATLGFAIKKQIWGSLSLKYKYQNKLPRLFNFTENFNLTSYRSIQIGQETPELISSNNYYLGYTFARIKKRILFQTSISYTDFKNQFTFTSLLSPNADISQRTYTTGQNSLLFNSGFTTYFDGLKSSAKIGFSYNFNERPINLNGIQTDAKNQTTTYFIKGTTYFSGILNFKALAQYAVNSGKTLASKVTNERFKFEGKGIFNISEILNASITHNSFIISNIYYETTNTEVNFIPKNKNWTLRLHVRNLLNNETYVFENASDFVQAESIFTSVPRYVILTGTIQF